LTLEVFLTNTPQGIFRSKIAVTRISKEKNELKTRFVVSHAEIHIKNLKTSLSSM